MSGGAIAGIVIGSVIGAAVLCALLVLVLSARRKEKRNAASAAGGGSEGSRVQGHSQVGVPASELSRSSRLTRDDGVELGGRAL